MIWKNQDWDIADKGSEGGREGGRERGREGGWEEEREGNLTEANAKVVAAGWGTPLEILWFEEKDE